VASPPPLIANAFYVEASSQRKWTDPKLFIAITIRPSTSLATLLGILRPSPYARYSAQMHGLGTSIGTRIALA
jgi:hypothetical protein